MNPPSALYGAMNKDRKPFTYTPGGLDLSEIKSERMAQRLMRNAMSEGVPEVPVQTIHSPPVQQGSGVIPNFNCLPVQVFPTFPLPANPKSLLRTRSNPDPTKESFVNTTPSSSVLLSDDISNVDKWRNINKQSVCISETSSNVSNKSVLLNDCKSELKTQYPFELINYGRDDHTKYFLPEKSYDAEYFLLEPKGNIKPMENKSSNLEEISQCSRPILYPHMKIGNENNPVLITSTASQDKTTNNFEQKEVKVVKKHTRTEKNEDQNGDTEAAVVVKLPAKKSSAKTETNVEVLKKILPDGTIEEVKTTTTKTTIDGKTEIKTETETRTIPKEESEDVVEIEEEEEEEEEYESDVVENNENEKNIKEDIEESVSVVKESSNNDEQVFDEGEEEYEEEVENTEVKENGLITNEEKLESSTTRKVTIIQSTEPDSEEEEEEELIEEEEEEEGDVNVEEVVILKKHADIENKYVKIQESEDNAETATEEEEPENKLKVEEDNNKNIENNKSDNVNINKDEEEEVEQNEIDEVEGDKEIENEKPEDEKVAVTSEEKDTKEEDAEEEQYEQSEERNLTENKVQEHAGISSDPLIKEDAKDQEEKGKPVEVEIQDQESFKKPDINEETNKQQSKDEHIHQIILQSEPKVSFREPSIPLEKVEDVEIKPISPAQEVIKKCHTEIITTTKDDPTGALSTQTEYNRIENIVTVNRTTKTLDNAYEQSEHSIPTVKTYFIPHKDRILSTPQPISRPYQPVHTPEPHTERRHSLLLDRLSVERQIPVQQTDIYQNNYNSQSYEQNSWLQEPQSEVLTVSNVKPSTITKNQQWYQQTKKETSDIVTPTPIMPSQLWSQTQPQIQIEPQPQPQSQYQSFVQPQSTPKADYQTTYIENTNQSSIKSTANIQQNVYPSYAPKPSWVSSTFDSKPTVVTQPNQYSTLKKDLTESYQKSTQQFSPSYVPPPWELESNYSAENQNYYQPPPTIAYTSNQTWKPKPTSKFSKSTPTSYIPPAPNQSFVKPVTNIDPPKLPGRKTYYSEYERRYISVPESTYIPIESKYQAQPDPSPQYYFDNSEPAEVLEPQWRKELREFTEKTSQTTVQTEKTSVRPPWEEDSKYAVPEYTTIATPTWTQTLRPRSWRERSYEPEYIGSKEWPRSSTLGRGRPQSSYVKSNVDTIHERPRGVSVDRYNPTNYQSPPSSEHPPVQSYTLNPNVCQKTYNNPNVPAYHPRASAEPKEYPSPYAQPRSRGETRVPPVQSRSFKYLQWITGTED